MNDTEIMEAIKGAVLAWQRSKDFSAARDSKAVKEIIKIIAKRP